MVYARQPSNRGQSCGHVADDGTRCFRTALRDRRCLLHQQPRTLPTRAPVDPLSVGCPSRVCDAAPGQPCRSRGGYVEDKPHTGRLIAARKIADTGAPPSTGRPGEQLPSPAAPPHRRDLSGRRQPGTVDGGGTP
ncbi:zinc finger domain-containing protein [Saccharothrix sp. NRRL B-16314]|uniref:zinc finger domain-containing protein n=1 Tax=Saccharothrix sp. NRRL B-16314 TaxID=1463825 RepID=UPI003FA72485